MSKQTMGEFLAVLRKANGYTQQEVADKLNISNRTLSSWETDRTAPDILLLPAIADLYGVTVDELLRGERGESGKTVNLSDAAIRSARKHRFGIFSFRCALLTGFGCLSVFLTALCSFFNLCVTSPLWLQIVLAVLGAGGFTACTTILVCFYMKAKQTEGIVIDEDYTDDKKAYALALLKKFKHYFWICALPLLLCTVVLTVIYFNKNPHDTAVVFQVKDDLGSVAVSVRTYLKTRFRIGIALNTIFGLILLSVFFACIGVSYKKLYDEAQKQTCKLNFKLALKLCLFGAIPVCITLIAYIVSYFYSLELPDLPIPMFLLFVFTTLVTFTVCIICYAKKHIKQIYKF